MGKILTGKETIDIITNECVDVTDGSMDRDNVVSTLTDMMCLSVDDSNKCIAYTSENPNGNYIDFFELFYGFYGSDTSFQHIISMDGNSGVSISMPYYEENKLIDEDSMFDFKEHIYITNFTLNNGIKYYGEFSNYDLLTDPAVSISIKAGYNYEYEIFGMSNIPLSATTYSLVSSSTTQNDTIFTSEENFADNIRGEIDVMVEISISHSTGTEVDLNSAYINILSGSSIVLFGEGIDDVTLNNNQTIINYYGTATIKALRSIDSIEVGAEIARGGYNSSIEILNLYLLAGNGDSTTRYNIGEMMVSEGLTSYDNVIVYNSTLRVMSELGAKAYKVDANTLGINIPENTISALTKDNIYYLAFRINYGTPIRLVVETTWDGSSFNLTSTECCIDLNDINGVDCTVTANTSMSYYENGSSTTLQSGSQSTISPLFSKFLINTNGNYPIKFKYNTVSYTTDYTSTSSTYSYLLPATRITTDGLKNFLQSIGNGNTSIGLSVG